MLTRPLGRWVMALLALALAVTGAAAPTASAAIDHTVTFVNNTGQTIWVGSAVNADGSRALTNMPTLQNGQSATIRIPETAAPGHWRGKFFARQGCTGTSGANFRCAVGDCGIYADRCALGEQPASLAEFNFDSRDRLAPWYNVSYVNAFSVPVTITPVNAVVDPGSRSCGTAGCPENLLPYCNPAYVKYGANGQRINCVNPNRDAPTDYSNTIKSRCPKAYAWSKQDTEPGNQTMYQCANCTGFTVTFNRVS
ncbi:thaumatin family protein [Lentzea sp. E54]|uniref:thaumatin family protein n=1 Tax=Lentzea xerophila TaxID=3435883 RepID=UPI003DA60D0D